MAQNQIELREIRVHKTTYDRLRRFGREQDSYSEIIDKMCDVCEGKRKRRSIVITDMALLASRSE